MKWFQQNRAFATFLIAFAICALLFGALVYRKWSIWTGAKQTFEQAAAERNRLKSLDPFPNEVNQRKLQEYLDKYIAALRNFKEALKAEVAPAPPLVERNVVDVSFKAAPGAARKVINEIAASTRQFLIIRTLYVHNEKDKGPSRERTANPTPPPGPQASPGAAGALNFIVGNEHIEVSATIEMLRFTF